MAEYHRRWDRHHRVRCADCRTDFPGTTRRRGLPLCRYSLHLAFVWGGTSFRSKTPSQEASRTTWFAVFALFGMPVLVFLLGLAVYWLTGLEDKYEERRRHRAAAE
jgi:hypothetical protein